MEKLAKGQGKRRADMYFATMNKKNPSDILKSAYENLVAELQAQAVMGISRDDRVSKTELLRRANMPCIKALIMKPKLRGLDMWFERTTRAFRRWSSSLTWLPNGRWAWKVTDKELLSSQVSTGKGQAKPFPAMPPVIGKTDEDLSIFWYLFSFFPLPS
ncbi:unnamed protein product [Porites evermanni]|uniref:Uncharacterized protein n=1 Tax=Porites evermanni TaxID=104178 RepID=A0ABN8SQA7_9CNID|nr:unnamed protein product [Porites evermanni]